MVLPDIHIIDSRPWLPNFVGFVKAELVDVVADYTGLNADIYDYLRESVHEELEFYTELINEAGCRVLELGCGTGCLAIPLAERGAHIVAVDNSMAMIDHLRAKVKTRQQISVVCEVADMADYVSHCRDSFDVVIIPYNSFVHILDPKDQRRVFSGTTHLLRRGGIFVVDVWLPRSRSKRTIPGWWPVKAPGGGWLIYSEQTFPKPSRRIANILTIPVGNSRPVATSIEEYVFTRPQILALFGANGFRTRIVPVDHPLIGGRAERFVVVGRVP